MKQLAVLLLLAPSSATAAGFYVTDVGARGMARAGAFVAAPDSVLAAHYNPAGLSLLDGLNVHVDASFVDYRATFDRRCPCAPDGLATTYDPGLEASFIEAGTQTSRTPLVIPFLGIAYGFEPLDLTVALTVHAPTSGRHAWDAPPSARLGSYVNRAEDTPGRYGAHQVRNIELNGALSVAMEVLPGLRIGGSAIVFMASAKQGQTLWANFDGFPTEPEQPEFDVPLLFSLKPSYFLNWALGASYEIVEGLSIGTSFRGKRSLRGEGTIEADLPRFLRDSETNEPLFGARIRGNEAQVELDMAPIWRTGIEYRMPGLFRAEAAVVYEGWSTHRRIVLRPRDIIVDVMGTSTRLPTITIDRGWQDTIAMRVGGELELFEPHVGLRAGYFYESSSIPDERLTIARIDRPKHGVALGASRSFGPLSIEIGLTLVHLVDANVDNSTAKIVAPFPAPLGSDEFVTTTGNGAVGAQFLIAALSLSYRIP